MPTIASARGPSSTCRRAVRDESNAEAVLASDVLAEAVELAVRESETDTPDPRAEELRAEERALSAVVTRLTLACETAVDVPELAARLRAQSARLREVRAELSRHALARSALSPTREAIEAVATEARAVLGRDVGAARDLLAMLLPERLRVKWEAPRAPLTVIGWAEPGRLLSAGLTAPGLRGSCTSPEAAEHTPRRVEIRRAV